MKKNIIAAIVAFATFGVFAETIPLRGVVEGYYGRPWGTEGRLSLLKFMGENNMNIFIYGPKDDPYHHSKWREPYPEKEMKDFKKLLEVAKANKINFCWAIHLGSGFKKGNVDLKRSVRKQTQKLSFGNDLRRHKVHNGYLQRTYILRNCTRFVHDEYIFFYQCLRGGKRHRYFNRHNYLRTVNYRYSIPNKRLLFNSFFL
jgi:hypothetical protein